LLPLGEAVAGDYLIFDIKWRWDGGQATLIAKDHLSLCAVRSSTLAKFQTFAAEDGARQVAVPSTKIKKPTL